MPNIAYSASQKRKRISSAVTILFVFLIILIDQASKLAVTSKLHLGESIPIIKDILHITFVKNTGAAFGLFKNSTCFFIIVSIVAVVMIGVTLIKSIKEDRFMSNRLFSLGLILVMSGALGNLIDRVLFRYVVDFIDVRIWPVFNIADSSITIGTALIILSLSNVTKQV